MHRESSSSDYAFLDKTAVAAVAVAVGSAERTDLDVGFVGLD